MMKVPQPLLLPACPSGENSFPSVPPKLPKLQLIVVIVLPLYHLVLLRKFWFSCALCHFSSFSAGDFGVPISYQMSLFICTALQLWH